MRRVNAILKGVHSTVGRNAPAATDQFVVATDQAVVATDQAAIASDQAASFNDLYFCIYKKCNGPGRVTIGETNASTKQTWDAARIIDRRTNALGFEYRILWLDRHRGIRRSQLIISPRRSLADLWKSSDVANFDEFYQTGKHAIAADMQGLSLFNAFKHIAELAGRPGIVSKANIGDFVAYERDQFDIDLTQVTAWKIFLVFLHGLHDDDGDFKFKPFSKQNFAIAGRPGARVLDEVELFDGRYLCALYNHSLGGHAFVHRVQRDQHLVFDQDQVMLPQGAT